VQSWKQSGAILGTWAVAVFALCSMKFK